VHSVLSAMASTATEAHASANRHGTLAQAVRTCRDALRGGHHIYYVGHSDAALTGLIDASEMPDTYSASFDDVRGFVPGGWATLSNKEGDLAPTTGRCPREDISRIFCIDSKELLSAACGPTSGNMPPIEEGDAVVVLLYRGSSMGEADLIELAESAARKGASIVQLSIALKGQPAAARGGLLDAAQGYSAVPVFVEVRLGALGVLRGGDLCLADLATKLLCNVLTTGAMVLQGKVYRNKLVCMTLANDKIFSRGLQIISEVANVSQAEALYALVRAIYIEDDPQEIGRLCSLPTSCHCQRAIACANEKVVTLAILLAMGKYSTCEQASTQIAQEPVIRKILAKMACQMSSE